MDTEERFWKYVDKNGPNGCWVWKGTRKGNGYGGFWLRGKTVFAHRYAYILTRGEIPSGLFACHHCDNRMCVNPDHIFIGTAKDNSQDCVNKGRVHKELGERKSYTLGRVFCCHGHELSPDNLFYNARGQRKCRKCAEESEHLKLVRELARAKAG